MKYALAYFVFETLLALASAPLQMRFLADGVGFIGLTGLILLVFKEPRSEEEATEMEKEDNKKMRKIWLSVFAAGLFYGLIFGTMWNSHSLFQGVGGN